MLTDSSPTPLRLIAGFNAGRHPICRSGIPAPHFNSTGRPPFHGPVFHPTPFPESAPNPALFQIARALAKTDPVGPHDASTHTEPTVDQLPPFESSCNHAHGGGSFHPRASDQSTRMDAIHFTDWPNFASVAPPMSRSLWHLTAPRAQPLVEEIVIICASHNRPHSEIFFEIDRRKISHGFDRRLSWNTAPHQRLITIRSQQIQRTRHDYNLTSLSPKYKPCDSILRNKIEILNINSNSKAGFKIACLKRCGPTIKH